MPNNKKKNKQSKKKSRKNEALETIRRIETSLISANALENPTKGLEAFCSLELQPSKKRQQQQHDSSSADDGINEEEEEAVQIDFYKSPLPEDLHTSCLQLFEENMGDMYRASSWGLDMEEKSNEFHHENARFLVATTKTKATTTSGQTSGEQQRERGDLLGFAHFRFDVNDDDLPTEEVLYVYEIQISSKARGCGLGRRLMAIMEMIAMRSNMRKVMLTVFKSNQAALGFYLNKMKYDIDESSPSNFNDDEVGGNHQQDSADYEILSKKIGVAR
mmetsp:Transcript_9673/g.13654  ORF Transcript_9673/g.13654 Transcript_9673/m.13654 type:complete len:275 (+) Transcript_9673:36-860(+)